MYTARTASRATSKISAEAIRTLDALAREAIDKGIEPHKVDTYARAQPGYDHARARYLVALGLSALLPENVIREGCGTLPAGAVDLAFVECREAIDAFESATRAASDL